MKWDRRGPLRSNSCSGEIEGDGIGSGEVMELVCMQMCYFLNLDYVIELSAIIKVTLL